MGEEIDSVYHVVFRSYTGALVNFYVVRPGWWNLSPLLMSKKRSEQSICSII